MNGNVSRRVQTAVIRSQSPDGVSHHPCRNFCMSGKTRDYANGRSRSSMWAATKSGVNGKTSYPAYPVSCTFTPKPYGGRRDRPTTCRFSWWYGAECFKRLFLTERSRYKRSSLLSKTFRYSFDIRSTRKKGASRKRCRKVSQTARRISPPRILPSSYSLV